MGSLNVSIVTPDGPVYEALLKWLLLEQKQVNSVFYLAMFH